MDICSTQFAKEEKQAKTMVTKTVNVEVIKKKKTKRLSGPTHTQTIIMHPVSSYSVKGFLNGMELKDLKKLAKSLDVRIGKNKAELVRNLWICDKIKQVAIITD